MAAPWRWRLVLASLASTAAIAGYLVFGHLSGAMVDLTVGPGRESPLAHLMSGIDQLGFRLFLTLLLTLASTYFEAAGFTEVGERAAARLRERLHGNLLSLPMTFFSKERSGELASRLLADGALLQESWTTDLRQGVKHICLAVGSLALLFLTAPRLALYLVLSVPPTVVAGLFFGRLIRERSAETQQKLAESSVIGEESLQNIVGVKACSSETWESARYANAVGGFVDLAVSVGRRRAAFVCVIALIAMSCMLGLLWQGSRQIAAHLISPGEFTSFMFYLALLGNAAGGLGELVGRIQRMAGAAGRIQSLLAESPEAAQTGWQPPPGNVPVRLLGGVAFRGASFAYPSRPEQAVLQDFNLTIAPGERVALVGPSGSGKSTAATLLFRLYDPSDGQITIDDRDLRDYAASWLRSQMALVPQDIQLFGGSVRENIAYGRPEATLEEIKEAARRAQAEEFISRLPQQYDTRLGDRGWQLSGGQRQRLAIARAILKNPAILVLDEATSALDHESERLVQAALEELMRDRTTLIISHRLGALREAARIAVMNEGAIVAEGTHPELLSRSAFYRQLCQQDADPR